VTADESRKLKAGNRVSWRGDAADSGTITATSWDAVTIAWDNGQLAIVHHGDMWEIHSNFGKVQKHLMRRRPPRSFAWLTSTGIGAL
jgi:hypothetical protein